MRAAALAACLSAASLSLSPRAFAQLSSPHDAPLGGRPAGMGRAYTALADDAYAPVWNPAGLGFSRVPQAGMLHSAAQGGAPRQEALFAMPLGRTFGAGASLDFSRGEAALGGAVGKRVSEHGALGAAVRYLEGPADQGRPKGYAADLAGMYRFDDRLSLGAAAANLGGRPEALRAPAALAPQARLGAGYSPAAWMTYALEGVFLRGGTAGVRSGVELEFWRFLAVRAGVDTTIEGSPALGLTAGAGVNYAGQSLDFAVVPRTGGQTAEQVSLIVRFGRLPERTFAAAAPEETAAPLSPAPAPRRSSRERPAPTVFHLEPSTGTVTVYPAAPPPAAPAAVPASVGGFVAPAAQGDWDKPKNPEIPEKPKTEEPAQPGMIWFQ